MWYEYKIISCLSLCQARSCGVSQPTTQQRSSCMGRVQRSPLCQAVGRPSSVRRRAGGRGSRSRPVPDSLDGTEAPGRWAWACWRRRCLPATIETGSAPAANQKSASSQLVYVLTSAWSLDFNLVRLRSLSHDEHKCLNLSQARGRGWLSEWVGKEGESVREWEWNRLPCC